MFKIILLTQSSRDKKYIYIPLIINFKIKILYENIVDLILFWSINSKGYYY